MYVKLILINFLKTIKSSIYSPTFYTTVPFKSFKSSIGYFLLLILLLTVIKLITLVGPLLLETPNYLQNLSQQVINCFPNDLEVKITNGQTSINLQEPYFLYCDYLRAGQTLAVIDTQTPFSQAKFDEYKAAVWVTKDSVVYKKDDFETRSYNLTQIKDFKLNQEVLNSYYNQFSPYLKFVGPLLLLFAFLGIYLAYDFRLIYILFLALIIWGLSKIFKRSLTYGQSYKVGLYALTLGLVVELVVGLTNLWTHFYGFAFMVTIITLGVVIVNFFLPRSNPT